MSERPSGETGKQVLVGCLAAMLLPMLYAAVGVLVMGSNVCMKEDTARGDLRTLAEAIREYAEHAGQPPAPDRGFVDLVSTGLLEKAPVDPWGQPYRLRRTDTGIEIFSLGRDGTGNDAKLVLIVRPGADGGAR